MIFLFSDGKTHLNKWIPEHSLYVNRQENMQKFCTKTHNESTLVDSIDLIISNKDLLEHILVDSKHNILYCYVPKVSVLPLFYHFISSAL